MVILVVDNYEQVTMLELALVNARIPYKTELGNTRHGITQPYLLVDGVPIDMERAFEWIRSKTNE